MVEVVLAEEDGGRIRTEHGVGPEAAHHRYEGATEHVVVGQLTVREAEVLLTGEAQHGRGRGCLGGTISYEVVGVTRRVGRALPAVGADQRVHLAAG